MAPPHTPVGPHVFSCSDPKIVAVPLGGDELVEYSCSVLLNFIYSISIIPVLLMSCICCFCGPRLARLIIWLKYYEYLASCWLMTNVRMLCLIHCQSASLWYFAEFFSFFFLIHKLKLSFEKHCFLYCCLFVWYMKLCLSLAVCVLQTFHLETVLLSVISLDVVWMSCFLV